MSDTTFDQPAAELKIDTPAVVEHIGIFTQDDALYIQQQLANEGIRTLISPVEKPTPQDKDYLDFVVAESKHFHETGEYLGDFDAWKNEQQN